ncbi:2Fe-2S iron-sulfur cluster-binding protein [Niabella ginsenosidivorans]
MVPYSCVSGRCGSCRGYLYKGKHMDGLQ